MQRIFLPGLFIAIFFLQKRVEKGEIKEYSILILVGFCFLFLSLGSFHFHFAENKIEKSVLTKVNNLKEPFFVEGVVVREPDTRDNNTKITLKPLIIKNEKYSFSPSRGKILVTVETYPEYEYGDKIEVSGEIISPMNFDEFDYKDYLIKEGIYSLMYFPEVKLIEKGSLNSVFSKAYGGILSFKKKLRESIYSNFSPPGSFLLGAVILGDKSKISDEWKEKLNLTGLRHVTAVSGMHVAIILGIIISFLNSFTLSRKMVFLLSFLFVSFFIVLTGLQVSALRAGLMAFFFLSADLSGRRGDPLKLLVFSAFLLLLFNPFLLRSDIGFHLSFSAMFGIFFFISPLRVWIGKIFLNVPNFLNFKDILALTFSAQVFTLPVLIYNFGYFSLISPLSNLLIVPFLPALMIFGFVSGVLGIIVPFLGYLFSFPAYFLLKYLESVISFLSSLSFSFVKMNIPLIFLVFYYLLFFFLGMKIRKEKEEWFLSH